MQRAARTRLSGVFCLVVAVATFPLSGCTLVGAGIGAGIDAMIPGPYEKHAPTERVELEHGADVDLGLRSGKHVRGRYIGATGPTPRDPETYLLVEDGERLESVPASDLSELGVEVSGKGWIYGGVIGLAIDATLVVAFIVIASNMSFSGQNMNLDFGR